MSTVLEARSAMTIRQLATLFPLSLDPAMAIWVLRRYGREKFPGTTNAKLTFWHGSTPPDGRSVQEWLAKGVLPINCGGGIFDHHPHGDHAGKCSFTMVLESLGLIGEPRFQELIDYVLWDDTRFLRPGAVRPAARESQFAWARTFKDLQAGLVVTGDEASDQEKMRTKAQRALYWLYEAVDCYMEKQDRLFDEGRAAFEAASKYSITDLNGKIWKMVVGYTNCREFSLYARLNNAAIVIQRRIPSGNIQIVSTSSHLLDLRGLAKMIRIEEARVNGRILVTSNGQLMAEGTVSDAPEWYFMVANNTDGASMLLNGTERHRNIPPTKIPFWRLCQIMKEWLAGNPRIS